MQLGERRRERANRKTFTELLRITPWKLGVGSWELFRYGDSIQRQDPHPFEGIRQPGARSVDDGNRGHRTAHGRQARGSDSAADGKEQVDGAPFAARGQEVA